MDSCTHTSPLIDIQPKKTRISMFKRTRISPDSNISEYQLSQLMPENLKSQLPTIEDIEATLTRN